MRWRTAIATAILLVLSAMTTSAQTTVYSSFMKFPNSYFDVNLGVDLPMRLTHRRWSSSRIYLVASPYLLWKGYSFDAGQLTDLPNMSSKLNNYQVVLPAIFRFEFAPNRIMLGSRPGKHDKDVAIFWDIGLAAHYSLSYHLKEVYQDPSLTFVYDHSLSPSSALTYTYMAIGFGARVVRWNLFLRYFQTIHEPTFTDPTNGWPSGVKSFYFQEYSTQSYYQQNRDYVFLCIGYSF